MSKPSQKKSSAASTDSQSAGAGPVEPNPAAEEASADLPAVDDGVDSTAEPLAAAAGTDDSTGAEPGFEDSLLAERDELQEKWLRAVAELDNHRKRARRELADSRRFAQADILRSLLQVLDNFERALHSLGADHDTDDLKAFSAGVELIFQNLQGLLKEWGVQDIEALGTEFDPSFHEAVGQLAAEGQEPGTVIEVVQKGYQFQDMVLRPVRVIIAS